MHTASTLVKCYVTSRVRWNIACSIQSRQYEAWCERRTQVMACSVMGVQKKQGGGKCLGYMAVAEVGLILPVWFAQMRRAQLLLDTFTCKAEPARAQFENVHCHPCLQYAARTMLEENWEELGRTWHNMQEEIREAAERAFQAQQPVPTAMAQRRMVPLPARITMAPTRALAADRIGDQTHLQWVADA